LGGDQAGHGVGDFAMDADDAFAEEAGEDVEGAFAHGAGFEDYRYEVLERGRCAYGCTLMIGTV